MLFSTLIANLHFIFAFSAFAALVYNWRKLSPEITTAQALGIQRADLIYGISASGVLIAGLLRVFVTEKGADFYFSTPFFHAKLTLFALAILISIYPTVQILKWRKATRAGDSPSLSDKQYHWMRRAFIAQVHLFVVIIMLASFIAKGYGAVSA